MSKHTLEALEQVAPLIGSALERLRFSVPADASILPIITSAIAAEKESAVNSHEELLEALENLLAAQIDPMGMKAHLACKAAVVAINKAKGVA